MISLLSYASGYIVLDIGSRLCAGRTWDRIPAGARLFPSNFFTKARGLPNESRGYFLVVKLVKRPKLEVAHSHLVPRLKMS